MKIKKMVCIGLVAVMSCQCVPAFASTTKTIGIVSMNKSQIKYRNATSMICAAYNEYSYDYDMDDWGYGAYGSKKIVRVSQNIKYYNYRNKRISYNSFKKLTKNADGSKIRQTNEIYYYKSRDLRKVNFDVRRAKPTTFYDNYVVKATFSNGRIVKLKEMPHVG